MLDQPKDEIVDIVSQIDPFTDYDYLIDKLNNRSRYEQWQSNEDNS
jgi:hypothetical protein